MKIDLRDIVLEAAAKVQQLDIEFKKQIAMPQMKGKVAQLWRELPDETKEKFAQEQPQAYAALMESLK